jgi:hypothetical protein
VNGDQSSKAFFGKQMIRLLGSHRGDGKRFIVRTDEVLTAFFELE